MTAFPLPELTDAQHARFSGVLDILAEKVTADETTLGVSFPYVTAEDGSWNCLSAGWSAGYSGESWSHGNWFCGFWVGLLLAAHLRTGRDDLLETGLQRLQLVAQRQDDPNTHDIGFIFLSSAIPAHHVTGNPAYAKMALRAADQLRARFVPTRRGGYISSWGPLSDPRGRASSAIDTMANLQLLYWAARHSGDQSYLAVAEAHARHTWDAFVRTDLSTCHAVEYDPVEGSVKRQYTFQGYADTSFWSRGQGWAILGLADTALATGDLAYRDKAAELAKVFLDRLDGETLPPWDFDDPAGSGATRDSSAGAIVANGLIKLAALSADPSERRAWHGQAVNLLENLCGSALAEEPDHRGMLKHACYSKPHGDGTDSAVLFGDYYFIEAICALTMPGRFLPKISEM